jgi:hypothetical protein
LLFVNISRIHIKDIKRALIKKICKMLIKMKKFIYNINIYYIISLYGIKMKVLHYPRLDTILSVEELLKESEDAISKNEIDRRLSKKIMRPTLNVILKYLEESGKISQLKEGIIWIYKEDISNKLKKKLSRGITI